MSEYSSSRVKAIWHIAANDLRLIFRDKTTLFWSFLGPLLFITFFGFIFKDQGPHQPRRVTMYIQNNDKNSVVADAMSQLLAEQNISVKTDSVPENTYKIAIPQGAAASIAQGKPPRIVLHSPNETTTYREQAFIAAAYRGLLGTFMGLDPSDAHAALDSAAIHQRVVVPSKVYLSEKGIQLQQITQGFQRYLPAYLVMFLVMNSVTGGAILLVMERKTGQLRRTMVASVRSSEIVSGKLLSRVLWSWSQILVIVLAGIFLYDVRFGAHPINLIVILFVFSLCTSSMGLLFGTLVRDPEKMGGFGSLLVLVMAALGGLWWPIEVTPDFMQQLAGYVPTGWAFDALNRSMAFDVGLGSLTRHLSLMLLLAVGCLTLASLRLRRYGQD